MNFKRKIYKKLVEWKNESKGSTALLVEGARRIGKSTIVEEFAKNEYKSYLLIDFSKKDKKIVEYFEDYSSDLDTFFMMLQTYSGVNLYNRESAIIFDEVQVYPQARSMIKHLVADGRYDYIETGSLISIHENVKNILIPSEEDSVRMYPMDFEEFAWALNENNLIEYIKQCYENKKPLDEGLHHKAMLLFKQYMLVGGMPRPLKSFLDNNKNFSLCDKEKRRILKLYREDIMKIKSSDKTRVLSIYDQIPGLLSKHEKRVIYKDLKSDSVSNDYLDAFFWLDNSMVCNECFNCSDPNVGLSINEDRTYIKCYMADTGLLVAHAFDENELISNEIYKHILNDKLSINEGMLYENAIAQMLVANGHKLYFYNHYNNIQHRNDIEIDFLISKGGKINPKIYPIEVKSNKKYSINSLIRFNDKFKQRIGGAYVIHPKNLNIKDNIIYLPAYMTFCIK